MKALINKSKSKRLITLSIVVVLLFQLILASVVNINFSEDVHAEALSPKDTLLLKVLKAGFKKCIDGGVLSKKDIKDSNIREDILFNTNTPIYVNNFLQVIMIVIIVSILFRHWVAKIIYPLMALSQKKIV